ASASPSASSVGVTSGTGMTCPNPFPGIEAYCTEEGAVCSVPNACCGGQAQCKGNHWTFIGPLCNHICGSPCGPDSFACEQGFLPIAYIGKTTTYQCAVNPCFEELGCPCVEAICEAEPGFTCNNTEGFDKVLCDCKGQC